MAKYIKALKFVDKSVTPAATYYVNTKSIKDADDATKTLKDVLDNKQIKLPSASAAGQVLKATNTTGGVEWGEAGGSIDHIKAGGKDLTIDADKRVTIDKALTKAEYDALSDAEKNNGMAYFVTDEECESLTRAVGEIVPVIGCSSSYVPVGCVLCDGAEYTKTQFPTLWSDYLTATTPKLVTCTYDQYASDIATYGQCAKWAIDATNNKFKVPTIKDGSFLQQAQSSGEIGKSYNAGLPNITGQISCVDTSAAPASGAFSQGDVISQLQAVASGGYSMFGINFDASRSSSIYGNSTTVQPNAVTVRYFVCVAGGSINQSMMDWSAWASGLAGKLNVDGTNLGTSTGTGTVKAVIESYYDSTTGSWYRVWSDGWIEQGGKVTFSSAGQYIYVTFLCPFTTNNYILAEACNSGAHNPGIDLGSREISRFRCFSPDDIAVTFTWLACGY